MIPLGGAGDRLGLKCEETGQSLPTAMLPYCGRTLLESIIRDLQVLLPPGDVLEEQGRWRRVGMGWRDLGYGSTEAKARNWHSVIRLCGTGGPL